MPDRPLLIFPSPTRAGRESLTSAQPRLHVPSAARQAQRIGPKFESLRKALEDEAISMRTTAAGVEPEQVIVLEIVGSVEDFANSVRRVEGLEWLAEWDQGEIAPDEDFFSRGRDGEEDHEKGLRGRVFLVISNQRGMDQLLSLWDRFQTDPAQQFDHGLNKFRSVFGHLRELRRWDERDRVRETGMLEHWREALEHGYDPIRFEVEFWYRSDEGRRRAVFEAFREVVGEVGGTCLNECAIPQVAYHAAVVQLPPAGVQAILDRADTRVLRSSDVMFFRPLGQCAVEPPDDLDNLGDPVARPDPTGLREPVAALLDGLPLENHPLLAGRLVVDDPEDWASSYPAEDRQHGTGMASLIIHGDLDADGSPLDRTLYVRPIMRPNPHSWRRPRGECIPEGLLPADLIHRAVRRMLEGDEASGPTAPSVRIINLSLGDPSQLFDYHMSAWARVLDWLSWQYKVLFIVSAGNHGRDILLDPVEGGISSLEPGELQRQVVRFLASELRHRRLLSPSESINSVTVGATHEDGCSSFIAGNRVDPLPSGLPSPGNALGHGFQRSVKPDILLPGGRQLYRVSPGRDGAGDKVRLAPAHSTSPPGIRVAVPASPVADRAATGYACGSSNSTALATRGAIVILDRLSELRSDTGGEALRDDHLVVLLKALLVHGADWAEGFDVLEAALREGPKDSRLKSRIARFLGYGVADLGRVLGCTAQRATLIGCESLGAEQGHEYAIPLPPSLGGRTEWRRLVITLAWISPINPQHHKYRKAHLWFDPPRKNLRVSRRQAGWKAARRGTIQHEVLEGDGACVISDGDEMTFTVSCRPDAGRLTEPVPYAVAVTLEVAEGVDIAIYDEVRTRLRPRIRSPGTV